MSTTKASADKQLHKQVIRPNTGSFVERWMSSWSLCLQLVDVFGVQQLNADVGANWHRSPRRVRPWTGRWCHCSFFYIKKNDSLRVLADGSRSTESLDSLGDQTLENKIKGGARLCWWAACFSCPCCTFEAFLKQWWILSLTNIAHCTVRKLHKHFFTAVMFEYFARKEWPSSCL